MQNAQRALVGLRGSTYRELHSARAHHGHAQAAARHVRQGLAHRALEHTAAHYS